MTDDGLSKFLFGCIWIAGPAALWLGQWWPIIIWISVIVFVYALGFYFDWNDARKYHRKVQAQNALEEEQRLEREREKTKKKEAKARKKREAEAQAEAERTRIAEEQARLDEELEKQLAEERLAESLKIIKEATRPISDGKDNSTMVSLIDEELEKIISDEPVMKALRVDDDAVEKLNIARQELREKGEIDRFVEKNFTTILGDSGDGKPTLIVKNT